MSDLISRQAALDTLDVLCQEHRYRIPGKRETYSQYNEAWQDALGRAEGAIGNLPPAQPGWIPVAERLPENDNDVLVTDGTDCAVAYWRTDAQAWDDSMHGWCDLYGLEVTAWMPLPTPYREGRQDDH